MNTRKKKKKIIRETIRNYIINFINRIIKADISVMILVISIWAKTLT